LQTSKLHFLAVTSDPTISQVALEAASDDSWDVVVFQEAAHVFSSPLDDMQLLLLDETATGGNYVSVIKKARRRFPAMDVVVIGGPKSDEVRAAERRDGVDHYFERPIETGSLKPAIEHRLRIAGLKASVGLVGRSPFVEETLESVLLVGPTEVPILIEGESGTGKDVIARALHVASRRADGPFVAINCASFAEGVLESELFGHDKGAFTGAVGQRAGVFERADRGSIFLDEVGEMSPNMQVRLLRVLESGELIRVGGVKSLHVDVRVIAATNRNLSHAVEAGTFRQDLYYRLKGINFYLPPLRDRSEDVPLLVDYFIREANRKHNKTIKGIDRDAVRRLTEAHWSGNIRELRNVIDTTVVLSPRDRITLDIVESQMASEPREPESLLPVPLNRSKDEAEREMIYASILALHRDVREIMALLKEALHMRALDSMQEVYPDAPGDPGAVVQSLSKLERGAIVEALRATNGNRRKASEMLGISERTLYRKLKEYRLG
jgi:DNA-binding NtrC family response regulator